MNRFTKPILLLLSLTAALSACTSKENMSALTRRVFTLAEQQYTTMDGLLTPTTLPRSYDAANGFISSDVRWWCSGFYPGALWYIYEYGGNEEIRKLAERNTWKLTPLQYVTNDHDVGFQLNCSFGNAYRLTGDKGCLEVMHQGARSLATRFNPTIGAIRSWDFVRKGRDWKFPVIIDNMMNLELLMVTAAACADDSLKAIACTHANTTLCNHFRPDYTSLHLVDYDPADGSVRAKQTVQGYADNSAWSRGQAWALYGYTMMARLTGYQSYLRQAGRIADMLLQRLPADGIPYWDFDAPIDRNTLRDASAAAIMASAFIELSSYTADTQRKEDYLDMAEKQLRTLASPDYLAPAGTNGGFLLKHCVGSLPDKSEVDVPLTYADYYFLEALLRYRKIRN